MSDDNKLRDFQVAKALDKFSKDAKEQDLRDSFASSSPVTFKMVRRVWSEGEIDWLNDHQRHSFMSLWAMLNYEYADAMLLERTNSTIRKEHERRKSFTS